MTVNESKTYFRNEVGHSCEVMDALSSANLVAGVSDGIWFLPDFAQQTLGVDPEEYLKHLIETYPERKGIEEILVHEPQWVHGSNKALRYRGQDLNRVKMWFQKGDPRSGLLRYGYTGWQWRVSEATADVENCKHTHAMARQYDAWAIGEGQEPANHYIVTKYVAGDHNIGFHFDKAKDITAGSLITVVKLGGVGRPFQIRWLGDTKPFFDQVLPPGSAIVMTLEANLATQHAVPTVASSGLTGSIVFRSIKTRIPMATVQAKLRQSELARERRGDRKRLRTATAAIESQLIRFVQGDELDFGNAFSTWQIEKFCFVRQFVCACVDEWEGISCMEKLETAGVDTLGELLEKICSDHAEELSTAWASDDRSGGSMPTVADIVSFVEVFSLRAWPGN